MRISLLETSLQKKTFFLRIWTLTSELVVSQINIIIFFCILFKHHYEASLLLSCSVPLIITCQR